MNQTPQFVSFIPLIIITLPIIIFNIFLAKRKGKSPLIYGFLSIIPLIGMYLAIYLASLTDKSVINKIEQIITLLEGRK